MSAKATQLLERWLELQLEPAGWQWLSDRLAGLAAAAGIQDLHKTLGLAPRRLGKADLALSEEDLRQARTARQDWDPQGWSVDEAARILAMCRFAQGAGDDFPQVFTVLCRSADVGEAIALYRGLPLYPVPERLEGQAAEGLRTNMRAVFEAIAHRNPYPRERFDEERWNQMVLKALFIGSTLSPIQGLDERANPTLAAILSDYAHERWAAGRPVSRELWRCLGPFADGRLLDDIKRLAASDDPLDRRAAALALSSSRSDQGRRLLEDLPELSAELAAGRLTWDSIAAPG